METRASFILVGGFVLSFFVAVVLAVLWLADVDVDSDSAFYDIYFEGPVSGLATGNAVRYDGIPVGIVSDMRISAERFGEVRVIIEIPRDVPIREDAVARLEYQGITGIGYIEIEGGTQAAAPLTAKEAGGYPEIASQKSAIQQVFDSAPKIAQDLEKAVEQVTKLLSDESIANINSALANINNFSGALSESSEDVALLLREGAATMNSIRTTAEQAEQVVAAFADQAEDISVATKDTVYEAQGLVQDVRAFTNQLDAVLAKLGPTLDNANRAIGSYTALSQDLRAETSALSGSMQTTLGKIDGLVISATGRVDSVADEAEDAITAYGALAADIAPMVENVSRDASVAVADFAKISGDMRDAATSIAAAADEARLLISENRGPVTNFSSTGLYDFTQLLSEMRVLVSALTRITTQIERDPAQFFFGDSQKGFEVQ